MSSALAGDSLPLSHPESLNDLLLLLLFLLLNNDMHDFPSEWAVLHPENISLGQG